MVLLWHRAGWQTSTPLRPAETWRVTARRLTVRGPWWRRQQPQRRRRNWLPFWRKLTGLFMVTMIAGMIWPLFAYAAALLMLGEMKRQADKPPPYPYRLVPHPARHFRREAAQEPERPSRRKKKRQKTKPAM